MAGSVGTIKTKITVSHYKSNGARDKNVGIMSE